MPSKCSHVIVLRVYFASFLIHSYDGYKSLWFVPAPNLLNLHLFPVPLPQPALSALSGSFQQPHLPPSAPTSTASWTITSPSCSSLVHKKKPRLLSPTVTALWCLVWLLLSCVSGSWNVACIYAHATSGKTGAPARAQQDWHSFKTLANLLTLFVSPALEGCSFPLFLWACPFYPVTAPPFCVFLCRRCLLTCLPHQSKEQALFLHLHHLASCLALRRCSTTVRLMNERQGFLNFANSLQ